MLAVFNVTTLNDAGTGSLREAITIANGNGQADTIAFSVTGTIPLASQLPRITGDLTILGPGRDQLTLDAGNGVDNEFNTGDGFRIFDVSDGNGGTLIDVTLRGLTLMGGDVLGADQSGDGGAIINGENLNVAAVRISDNATFAGSGGGIFNRGSGTVNISSTIIADNMAEFEGGGITNFGQVHISGSNFTNNSTMVASGGGISNVSNGELTITTSTFVGNSSSSEGGGVFNSTNSTATISNSVFRENTAEFGGGALRNLGVATINDSTLTENHTVGGGGGGISNSGSGSLTVTESTFHANSTDSSSGAIFNSGNATATINNSQFTDNDAPDGNAGAIGNFDTAQLMITHSTFVGNNSHFKGGGIFSNSTTTSTVSNTNFARNTARTSGGSIANSGAFTVTDSTFTNNNAVEFNGGAILNGGDNAVLNIGSSSFTGNIANGVGGGIANFGEAVVTESQFFENSANSNGGALFNDVNRSLTIERSTITGNLADAGGGIVNFGDLEITDSTLNQNISLFEGGGIANFGMATVRNSTFSGNAANGTGGAFNNTGGATLSILTSTIVDNRSDFVGGISNTGTLMLESTIVAQNSATFTVSDDIQGTVSGAYNLIGDGTGQSGLSNNVNNNQVGSSGSPIDPMIGLLVDNGGPTQTHALLPGSPAIDSGSSLELNDQRGEPFVRNDGNGVDIGAYERQSPINLSIIDAYLINYGDGQRTTAPVIGQMLAVQVLWSTLNLPSDVADYEIEITVDGVAQRNQADPYGAGLANGTYFWTLDGWYATPGEHTVLVSLDVDDAVTGETIEADNQISFAYTTVAPELPQSEKLVWPLQDLAGGGPYIGNYHDVDATGSLQDFAGGNFTYNGHGGIDVGASFAIQDQGLEVYAAMSGVVESVREGRFDRSTLFAGTAGPEENRVAIDHGNGWKSHYVHLRRDSIQVEVGQSIVAGQKIGLMGSSGGSSGSHLHFDLQYKGMPVETFLAPSVYWNSPKTYTGDLGTTIYNSFTTNYVPFHHLAEAPSDSIVYRQEAGLFNVALGQYLNIIAGDSIEFAWYRPNGTLYSKQGFTSDNDADQSNLLWSVTLPDVPDLGSWRIDYLVNDAVLKQDHFQVTIDGLPELRIEEPDGNVVLDGRFTPYDFGTVELGDAAPTKTFTVINHGYNTLDISGIDVPVGYLISEGLPANLAPGASDTFTIERDTSVAGYISGEVFVETNDSDESISSFAVESSVTFPSAESLLLGVGELTLLEGKRLVGNVRRTGDTSSSVTVSLSVSDNFEIALPFTVTLPAGADYAPFFFDAVEDLEVDGNQRIRIDAIANGYASAFKDMSILDSEQVMSADFDADNDVDGADFLAWQRGFGTPNATKADGDADNDLDVDGSDLAAWQAAFGGTPLSAATVGNVATGKSDSPHSDVTKVQSPTNSELFDAALALVLSNEQPSRTVATIRSEPPANHEITRDAVFAVAVVPAVPPEVVEDFASLRPNSPDSETQEQYWISDKLLETVFE